MARLILISIPDNAEADAFVKAIESDNVLRAVPVPPTPDQTYPEVTWDSLDGAKVEAVWAKPTKFCDCPDYEGKSLPTKAYRWLVHAKCSKPRPGALQHPRDLTRPDWKANEIPYYIGFRADGRGWVYRKEDQ